MTNGVIVCVRLARRMAPTIPLTFPEETRESLCTTRLAPTCGPTKAMTRATRCRSRHVVLTLVPVPVSVLVLAQGSRGTPVGAGDSGEQYVEAKVWKSGKSY